MARIRQAGPPVLIVALIAGLIGYLFGCTRGQRERVAQAQETETAKDDGQTDQDGAVATQDSPVRRELAISTRPIVRPSDRTKCG